MGWPPLPRAYRLERKDIAMKILQCPFCGKTETCIAMQAWEINMEDEKNELDCWAVCCDVHRAGCGATGGFQMNEQDAIERWNMRHDDIRRT